MSLVSDITIHVSDGALMHLLLAGMESYRVRKRKNSLPLETGGLLWGYVKDDETIGMDHITIEHVSTDTYAERTHYWNQLNDQTTKAKQELMAQRWPHLTMVGDFHTHPYRNYSRALRDKGWQFSKADYHSYEGWESSEGWPGRVGVVLTIAELKRSDTSYAEPSVAEDHILYWQLGQYRFWLAAYAVDRLNGGLVVTPKDGRESTREHVYIDVPTINGTTEWFNYSED